MKEKSWSKHSNNPKFWNIFANIVLKDYKTNKTMKSVKIDIPEGYEVDKEKSTFENIVFKKVDDVVLKWNKSFNTVEIKAEGEYFMLNAGSPSFYCTWNEAVKYYDNPYNVLKLPTIRQLKIISKYISEINKIIRDNKGFEIRGGLWSCEERNEVCAWIVYMSDGYTSSYIKGNSNFVRAVIPL